MNFRPYTVIVPLAFFLCGAVGTGFLYRMIERNEQHRVRLETEITAEQMRLRLEAWIDSRTALVEHLGIGQFRDATDIKDNFRHHALTFIDLNPGIQALNFIDQQWVIRQVVPAASNAPALNKNLHAHPDTGVVFSLQKSADTGQLTGTSIINLLQGGKGFATYHPLTNQQGTTFGFVNGVFRIQQLVDACLYEKVLRNRFSFHLVDDNGDSGYTHQTSGESLAQTWQVKTPVRFVDRNWQLYVTPDAGYLARSRTSADEIMAVLGMLLFAGLAILLRVSLQRQEALRRSQAKYRLLVENQIDLVVKLDPQGNHLYVSPSYCETFGRSESELLGTNFLPLVHPDDRDLLRAAMDELSRPPHRSYVEQRSLTKNGTAWQAWTNSAVLDADGKLEAITSVGRDITRRRELEEQLGFSRKMQAVGQLAGGIAHDFNNLLQSMLGNLQFVIEDTQPTGQTASDLNEIEQGIGKSMTLTRQLLAFSRKQELQAQRDDLNAVVESTLEQFRRTLRSSISVVFQAGDTVVPVRIDRGQIEQIVLNICENARDAIVGSGSITISTATRTVDPDFCRRHPELQPGEFATLTVEDSGHGMPPEVQARIFEPFYTTRDVGAGTGLGLATSYGIVKQHDGTILVTSTVGEGARFTVLLPLAQDFDTSHSRSKALPPTGNGETILLAEDEISVRELAVRVLERANYKVLVAEDGEQAVAVFSEHQASIDLVMLDMVMPKMNGREARDAIVAIRPVVPILFASGYDPATLEDEGLTDDNLNLLMKPYGIRDLLHKVDKTLNAHQPPDILES